MKKIGHIASLFMLVAALCFALSISSLYASEKPAVGASHTVTAEGAADGHGEMKEDAAAHGEGSLSDEKLKDLFWRVINFAALMIILVKFAAKPIGSALSGRQKGIKDELEDLEKRRDEAEKQYRAFEAKLGSVEKDIDTIVEKAIAQAEVEKAKIIEKAEQAVDDLKRSAEQAIQNEIVEARRMLKNDVADQAAVMAEELIVSNLKPADQVKIIENYLDKVGAIQ
jgi:F-type H+-transporting ATPase subunit b